VSSPTTSGASLVLTNAVCWTGDQLLPNARIVITGNRIASIGRGDGVAGPAPGPSTGAAGRPPEAGAVHDLGGRLVMPGIVNFHTHLYSALAPGLHPVGPTDTFSGILEHLWWRLDAVHDEQSIRAAALLGAVVCAEAGVTTVFDHHASANVVDGSLDIVAQAIRSVGLRGVLCFEASDRGNLAAHINENVRFHEANRKDDTLRGTMGMHASLTLGNSSLERIAEARPSDMPSHIHAGESPEDLQAALSTSGTGPVARLNRFGLLDSHSIIAHAIHLADEDYELIDSVGPTIVTAPLSNMNNDVGMIDTRRIRDYVFGTDGIGSDMITALRTHYLAIPTVRNRDSLLRAFGGRAREIVDFYFPGTGAILPGQRADVTVLDYVPAAPVTKQTLVGHLVFGVAGNRAHMTVADGAIVVKDGVVTKVDRAAVLREARDAAAALHKRFYG
jgi:cytosine/adenosine deaminase-related metal-dependent hydrolase